ncbi:MAG: diacylglycerol kinase [Rhizobiales bacterium]|nr:diacylglycerol kinase [Hyphomicrobiales bacterium]
MRIYRATLNTFRGLALAARSEAAVRQEIAVLAVAIPLGFFLAPNVAWYVAMIGVLWVVVAVELLNTAIEKMADHVTPEWHSQIGMIKDCGSAAVFCTLCLAALVWIAGLLVRLDFV